MSALPSKADIPSKVQKSPMSAKSSRRPILRFGGCAIVSFRIRFWTSLISFPLFGSAALPFRSRPFFYASLVVPLFDSV